MRLFIYATGEQEKEIRTKPIKPEIELFFSTQFPNEKDVDTYDVFFLLKEDYNRSDGSLFLQKPVIIHSVSKPLSGEELPLNVARINGWPGFLQRSVWEIATKKREVFQEIYKEMGWEIIFVKDTPGLIAARVVSMIINEAYYALKENVSTKNEINIAMKLGTNYPLGPFEWAQKIGVQNVFDLLTELAKSDQRCIPSFQRDGNI